MMLLVLILSGLNYTIPDRDSKIKAFLSQRWLNMKSDSLLPDFRGVIDGMSSIDELYLLDSLMLSAALYSKSDFVESRLLKVIKCDDKFVHSSIARNYAKRGVLDLKAGNVDKAQRELKFALKSDPSNRNIPIILMKCNIPKWGKVCRNLWEYFYTYGFLDNRVSLIENIMFLFVIFLGLVYIAFVISGLFESVPFLSEWVRQRMKISNLWVPALLFSLFVWLPILIFLAILVGISFVKMSKKSLINLTVLSVIFPLAIAYTNQIKVNFSTDSPTYQVFKARCDPYNYRINESENPYGYVVKGIEAARMGELTRAESLFQKGYEEKESLIFLTNAASVYFKEGNYDDALSFCKKVVSLDPDNPISNLIMATIYLDRLDFDEVSEYIERATKSGPEFADRELPIYQYPPDSWLLSDIFRASGVGLYIKESKLYIFFILTVFFVILSSIKRLKDGLCPICGRILINSVKIGEEKVCDICADKLSVTESKSIRERLKRRTKNRSHRVTRLKNFIMNLIFPGSAHLYNRKSFTGIGLLLLGSVLLVIYVAPLYFSSSDVIQYKASIGNIIYRYSLIIYYLLVLLLTWRLGANGDRR